MLVQDRHLKPPLAVLSDSLLTTSGTERLTVAIIYRLLPHASQLQYKAYAEEYFTDYAADRLHNPTVKSCLLRIPGTLNSKCIHNENHRQITIIQKWDGKRPHIQTLLRDFRRWLIQKRIDDIEELKKREKKTAGFHMIITSRSQPSNNIKWIENGILKNPLRDHYCHKKT
jgi:hypothetical protein